jgi:hypothetical protein
MACLDHFERPKHAICEKFHSGEGGIRTHGGPVGPQRFSRPPRSTTLAPLQFPTLYPIFPFISIINELGFCKELAHSRFMASRLLKVRSSFPIRKGYARPKFFRFQFFGQRIRRILFAMDQDNFFQFSAGRRGFGVLHQVVLPGMR